MKPEDVQVNVTFMKAGPILTVSVDKRNVVLTERKPQLGFRVYLQESIKGIFKLECRRSCWQNHKIGGGN